MTSDRHSCEQLTHPEYLTAALTIGLWPNASAYYTCRLLKTPTTDPVYANHSNQMSLYFKI